MDIVQGFLDRTDAYRFVAATGKRYAIDMSIRRETFEIVCHTTTGNLRALDIAVSLHDIREVRAGKKSKDFQACPCSDILATHADSHCFVIFYGDEFQLQTLSVALKSHADAKKWIDGIEYFRNSPFAGSYPFRIQVWVFKMYEWLKQAGDFAVTPKEMKLYYAAKLGRKIHLRDIVENLAKVTPNYSNLEDFSSLSLENAITWEKFEGVTKHFLHNQQIFTDCFGRYTTGRLFKRDFLEFLRYEQNEGEETLSAGVLKDYFLVENKGRTFAQTWLGFVPTERAVDYLFSPDNTIWDRSHDHVVQDMSHPLSHYWIASSHNTYLTGDQLSSQSSVEAYVRCLRQGCRCIELDCFDGPKGLPLPVIYHGFTLTSKISFVEVLEAIRDHAFATSEYPVIISIENHCGLEQQKVMAEKFKEILGDMLITEPLASDETRLPSPEQLKRRIILKGRKLSCSNLTSSSRSIKLTSVAENGAGGGVEDADNMVNMRKTGKMYLQNGSQVWEPFFFALTESKLLYTELKEKPAEVPGVDASYFGLPSDHALSPEQMVSNLKANLKDLHFKKRWFHGDIATKEEAVIRAAAFGVDGAFLVRKSATGGGSGFAICFYAHEKCWHMRIEVRHRGDPPNEAQPLYFLLSGGPYFPSVYQLITYYRKHALDTKEFTLQPLTKPVPQPCTQHENQPWFYKDLDRDGAEKVLRNLPLTGCIFLVRYSSEGGGFVISFRIGDIMKHCRVVEDGRLLTIGGVDSFETISDLVRFYRDHVLYKGHCLQHPVTSELLRLSEQSECEGPELVLIPAKAETPAALESDSPFGTLQKGAVELSETKVVKNVGVGGKAYPYVICMGGVGIAVPSQSEAKEWQEAINEIVKQRTALQADAKSESSSSSSKVKPSKIAPELSDLIVYAASIKSLPSLETIRARGRIHNELTSFSETFGEKCMSAACSTFVWLHQVKLCRIYPKGQRVDSSNYSPVRFWNYGAQMVALNWQTPDKAMQLNHGRFRANGRCGYVLKPEFMLSSEVEGGQEPRHGDPLVFDLCIIAGRHLLLGKPGLKGFVNPFVELEVHGANGDNSAPQKWCSKIDKANALNPFWNQKFTIEINTPELALLRFVVQYNDTFGDPVFLAQATFPAMCLREGYRSVELTNGYSEEILATLLVHLRRRTAKETTDI